MVGYVRKLDLDGFVRIRESDHAYSPTLFDGKFKNDSVLVLKEAFKDNLPVEFHDMDGVLLSVKIFKHPKVY